MLALTQVGATTPVPLLLGIHLVLSTGLAFLFTPAFTTALNPLTPKLYSHGSAILSTLQQVAGAAGVALLVTIMTLAHRRCRLPGRRRDRRRGRRSAPGLPGGGRHRVGRRGLALTLRRTEVVDRAGSRSRVDGRGDRVADADLR